MPEHHGLIPVGYIYVSSFWRRIHLKELSERFPWNLVSYSQVRSREHLVPPTAIRAAAFLDNP